MDGDEEEFTLCGDGGNAEDALFDELVGAIENFMVNFSPDFVFSQLPPFSSISNEHERHKIHTEVLARVESELDAYVMEHCHSVDSMEVVANLISSRKDEVVDEVWDFVSEGCFDYNTFLTMWEMYEKLDAEEE